MPITDLVTLVLRESSTAALAVLALWMLKQSYEQRMADIQEQRDTERQRADTLQATLMDVSERLGENAEIHRRLLRFLESLNGR